MEVDKSKWKYDYDNCQRYRAFDYINQFGKARFTLECPFCKTNVTAYVWSLSGGGKKCPKCGAIHTPYGSYPKKESNEKKMV